MSEKPGSLEAPHALHRPPLAVVVEPSRTLVRRIAAACQARGAVVRSAKDVAEALRLVCEDRPTVVFTAFELPGLSGTALIAALKSDASYRAIPIALTTSTHSDAALPGAYSPDAVLRKDDGFAAALDSFLASAGIGTAAACAATPDAAAPPLRGARILLAEDTACIQKLVARMLHSAGADVTVVDDGEQAVAAASGAGADLILMDVEMPGMDGPTATRTLRARGLRVPIIAFTAHESEAFRSEALACGCDDVLVKPVAKPALLEMCGRWLRPATGVPATASR